VILFITLRKQDTYVFMLGIFTTINQTVLVYWIILGLVTCLWQGLIIAAIYK